MSKTKLEKHTVCIICCSPIITDPNCICCHSNHYQTVELEFLVCECCGNLIDAEPADSVFNKTKL